MKKIVSLFPDLEDLGFKLWSPSFDEDLIPGDTRMVLKCMIDWELQHACPKLSTLSFDDYTVYYKVLIELKESILLD